MVRGNNHGDYLYRHALSRPRSGEAAEEVVQQSFLAALQHTDQFAGRGSERAWLLGILKRKIIDFIRRKRFSAGGETGSRNCDRHSAGHWIRWSATNSGAFCASASMRCRHVRRTCLCSAKWKAAVWVKSVRS